MWCLGLGSYIDALNRYRLAAYVGSNKRMLDEASDNLTRTIRRRCGLEPLASMNK